MNVRKIKNGLLILGGILTRKNVFVGPRTIQFFVSARCLEQCPWCGVKSIFIKKKKQQDTRFIDFSLTKKLIDDVSRLGTAQIKLFGEGEPLLHPDIIEMARYIRKAAMECAISTSGTPLDNDLAKHLARIGVHFGIGLHAGKASTWTKIFSSHSEKDFKKLCDIIAMINHTRGSSVTVDFVISNINHLEIVDFLKLAIQTGCYAVNYVPLTTFDGTEFLKVNNKQAKIVKDQISEAQAIAKNHRIKTNLDSTYLVSFSDEHASFSTEDIYRRMPCYIGWSRAYIAIDGKVYPCCALVDKYSMGNAFTTSFKEIWHSEKYRKLRQTGIVQHKENNSYIDSACASCLEYYYNARIHELLHLRL
ncbi:radical SAM/SPASM domain-containing protein [Candidatus Omnitrophota bacterium]